ncbi:hypothetical protein [Pedobacter nyackensis]|uniref:hypothetical protein n=1 Tax=Pedobacter nyackensis TaxID=475255 RepID=UPI002931C22E|nr:hypothetical protein [Pedobacter nyackensis]
MAKKNKTNSAPSQEDIEQYQMLFPMIIADLTEVKNLSNKKPDGLLNKLKVSMINKKLEKIKQILSTEPTVEFLDILDADSLPSNSDAVFIILQFKTAMEQFKDKHYTRDDDGYEYDVDQDWSWKTR